MAREDKVATVAEIADRFRTSTAAVLTDYRGLSVAQLKELRRSLGGTVTFSVVKNTLTKRAAAMPASRASTICSSAPAPSHSSRATPSMQPRASAISRRTTRHWSSRAATWTGLC